MCVTLFTLCRDITIILCKHTWKRHFDPRQKTHTVILGRSVNSCVNNLVILTDNVLVFNTFRIEIFISLSKDQAVLISSFVAQNLFCRYCHKSVSSIIWSHTYLSVRYFIPSLFRRNHKPLDNPAQKWNL